jgi:hypothetical protein
VVAQGVAVRGACRKRSSGTLHTTRATEALAHCPVQAYQPTLREALVWAARGSCITVGGSLLSRCSQKSALP